MGTFIIIIYFGGCKKKTWVAELGDHSNFQVDCSNNPIMWPNIYELLLHLTDLMTM